MLAEGEDSLWKKEHICTPRLTLAACYQKVHTNPHPNISKGMILKLVVSQSLPPPFPHTGLMQPVGLLTSQACNQMQIA